MVSRKMSQLRLVRLGLAQLPAQMRWRQTLGFTAGNSFTMAIFIATLANQNPHAVNKAKLALLGSGVAALVGAALVGAAVLWFGEAEAGPDESEASADSASF